ncbi:replication initiation protein [Salmonella enterica subsp. enterica serovar Kentucky]|uniref:plasmid replication initiator RepA n=1 Tax=Escherichia coli TaxID=562 RepID=UPI00287E7806|nr:incFII family plasmid replication initiator RepA [Salmonella enterica subsp. enterica serovar Kentucky]EHO0116498.1 replication initiation protein [Salmonella enterica]EDK6868219.1 incFII family plasmid replication initiator RepA [Salmonella enterica subsp. enterica serovar Kentucky]EGK3006796.1 replication initiation protein [Salmonella enterica subsp. enterica serovar Kentucky]EGM7974003.1 replication initiation protein [Salmonella enterica subsp. enterica serovar Kentucky]
MTDLQQTYYRQVKNPNPVFTPREGAGTLKFCEKLMEKAVGFTSRFDFAIHVAHARSKGLRRRMPPVLRRRAIDALLQGLCFHYDPLANRVQCSITTLANRVQCSITTLAIECGLATESAAGKLSITRATRALTFLAELGLITYQTEYDPLIGCYIPTDITFTPALFAALDVSEDAVVAARRSRVEWENRQRKKQGLDTLGMDELIAKAWRFVRERFRSYQTELKSRGIKRARARRDANRERQDIVTLVKRQLTREISEGRFTANREAVKREVERRVKERMILSRNRNYSRLATASP